MTMTSLFKCNLGMFHRQRGYVPLLASLFTSLVCELLRCTVVTGI